MQKCFIMFFILVATLVVARTVYEKEAVAMDFATMHKKDTLHGEVLTVPLMEDMAMGQNQKTK